MDILRYLSVTVEVICSLALITLVLIQKSKSEGLGLAFGSGMGETLFGSRAGNILTKLTVIFAVVFLANTLLLSQMYAGARGQSLMRRAPIAQQAAPARQMPAPQPRPAPAFPVSTEEAPAIPMAFPVEE